MYKTIIFSSLSNINEANEKVTRAHYKRERKMLQSLYTNLFMCDASLSKEKGLGRHVNFF